MRLTASCRQVAVEPCPLPGDGLATSLLCGELDMRARRFTLKEANAQLPWLEDAFARLSTFREEHAQRQDDVLEVLRGRGGNGASSHDQEISDQQRAVERLTRQIREELQEIANRGVMVRDVGRGLVDFPSRREGREICLCWLRGEAEIGYWHGADEGFASRKPL